MSDSEESANKLVVVGDMGVGKTCIISRFINGTFTLNPVSTVGANYSRKIIDIPELDKELILDIWDTAGQEQYKALAKIFFQGAKLAILVYDITRKESFDSMKDYWYKKLKEFAERDIVIGIAGNKSDLYLNEAVPEKEARNYAKSIGAAFGLTSAMNNSGIEDLINTMGIKFLDPNYVINESEETKSEEKSEQKTEEKEEEKKEKKEDKKEEKKREKEEKRREKEEKKREKEERKREKKEEKRQKKEEKRREKEEKKHEKELKKQEKEEKKQEKKEEKEEKKEEKEEKIEEKIEEKDEEKKEIEVENDEDSYNLDKETREYFSNFEDKEISLILSRRKLINEKNNFSFLYSKFEVIYNDKFLSKSNIVLCTEFLVSYINPKYSGNFGYESQISGMFPKKITLEQCFIKGNKIDAKMINNGKIASFLIIEDEHKINLKDDIIIFEFVYHITQIKNYGIRLINVEYNDDIITCSMTIKYDKNKFSIKSKDDLNSSKKNEFYIFNKNKFCLSIIDKDSIISLNEKNNKFNIFINEKLSLEEIQKINNSLKSMDIKPLEPNLIYEKIVHELHEQKDYIKGFLLIFQPSFEKYYFDLFKIVNTLQNDSIFKIKELKVNNKTVINLKKSETKKSDNYYKLSDKSYCYNISTREDFVLIEFQLIGKSKKEEKVKYDFDPKQIFNIFFSKGTSYFFEIILNGYKVSFGNDKEYKYKEVEEKIIFEGNWELDDSNGEEEEEYLPKEIYLKDK